MDTMVERRPNVVRLEGQVRRLRNRLAEAWQSSRRPVVIRRLEGLMRRRWRMLDKHRHHDHSL